MDFSSSSTFTAWLCRLRSLLLIVGLILTGVAAAYSVSLYRNLRTDMEELLPETARSVRDLKQVRNQLRSTQSLAILVFSKNPDASRKFIRDFSRNVQRKLSDQIQRVEFEISDEIRFFKDRRALFIDTSDLVKIRDYIRDRIQYETDLRNPLTLFRTSEVHEPKIDLKAIKGKYREKASSYTKFKDGYFANAEETIRAALIFPSQSFSGIASAQHLMAGVQEVVKETDPKRYAPDLEVKYTGDIADFVEEHHSLISDLAFSTIVVTVMVSLAMLLFFRDIWTTLCLLASLAMGTLWTFGVAYFVVGYLNANSAFLGSIVIGNGINFGIIFLARYLEERRAGMSHERALADSVGGTWAPTLTAALAAALAYGSLAFTEFRGFRQFGIIGLFGMVLCWISAYLMLPALLDVLNSIAPRRRIRGGGHVHGFSRLVAALVRRASPLWIFLSVAGLAASGVSVARYHGQIIETDTSKLRDKRSLEQGSVYLKRYLDEIFGRYLSPLVIMLDNDQQRDRVERALKREMKRQGPSSMISKIYSVTDVVPPNQRAKVQVLREIRELLKPKILGRLKPGERRLIDDLALTESLKPFRPEELPSAVQERFRLRSGKLGHLVLVEPVLDTARLSDESNQNAFVSTLRRVADSIRPGAPVVGTLPVTVDMYQSVRRDGPKATAVALLSVIVLVAILTRNLASFAMIVSGLLLGAGWFVGVIFGFDLKINFLNFIAFPITFGIGVDYAVNVVQRYRDEGRGSILHVIRETGSAVALASFTTVTGYSSLLLAGNQAFFSFGRLATLGEVTCIIAALISVPAYLYLRDVRKIKTGKATGLRRGSDEEQRPHAA